NEFANYIFKARKNFLETFIPIFKNAYEVISGGKENVNLAYESHLYDNNLKKLLEQNLKKNKALQYTSVGIHKDDLSFEIEQFPIKKFGSQGQQKSFLIALKLAQFQFIKEQAGVTPILLLDDIFDKLDENRVSHIIKMVNKEEFGQIFISDTHTQRTETVIKETGLSYDIFRLKE